MSRLARALVCGVVLAVTTLSGPLAYAAFKQSATARSTFATTTLAPPTGLVAVRQCSLAVLEVKLTWTATTSAWADGYEVTMATSSSGPWTPVPAGAGGSTATTRTASGLLPLTTYWFRVAATKGAWRSAVVQTSQNSGAVCL